MTTQPLVCNSCHTPLPVEASFCYVCGTPTPTSTSAESGATETRPSLTSAAAVVDTRRRLERALGRNFTVRDLVGRGGFAEVFRVRDERLKRDLAVKVLSPELVVNEAMLQRFRREAEAIAALRHPGIVPIYDIGEVEGIAYIVMPLIRGETLRRVLEVEGRLSPAEVRRILREIAAALAVAHEAGLVHRDIKPENVMLEGPSRQVLVMDFGIAKALDPEQTGMTSSGLIVGTPHFMSPEQASGDAVDGRSDQYSLAVLGYRLVTGLFPFEGETTRALLYKQVFETPVPAHERFPEVPKALSDALHRGMAKEAANRYPTITEFADAVMAEEAPAPAAASARGRKPRLAVVAGVGTVLVALLGWALGRTPAAPDPAAGAVGPDAVAEAAPPPPATAPGPATAGPNPVRREPGPAGGPPTTAGRTAAPPSAAPTCVEAVRSAAWETAATLCEAEAAAGRTAARLALAAMYERGTGVPRDPVRAVALYQVEMEGGSAEAAWRLGTMLEEGSGIPRNMTEAANAYLQAARRGHAQSMRAVARLYATGEGVRRNEAEAVSWYRRAAAANDVPSLTRLAELFTLGRGVSRNEEEAARLYTRAAEAGDLEAQYALAMAYFNGRGLARSDSLGLMWLGRAAERGYGPAQEELVRRR